MTSGQCCKTIHIHSDHFKQNKMLWSNCECHPLFQAEQEKMFIAFSPHLASFFGRKGNYVSVNHHYSSGGSDQCLGFLIRCDAGSEDQSRPQVMRGG